MYFLTSTLFRNVSTLYRSYFKFSPSIYYPHSYSFLNCILRGEEIRKQFGICIILRIVQNTYVTQNIFIFITYIRDCILQFMYGWIKIGLSRRTLQNCCQLVGQRILEAFRRLELETTAFYVDVIRATGNSKISTNTNAVSHSV